MSEDVKITEYPTELHPTHWEGFETEFFEAETVRLARDTYMRGVQAWGDIVRTDKAVLGDVTNTHARNLQRAYQAATKRRDEWVTGVGRVLEKLEAEKTAIDTAMNRVPRMPTEGVALKIADRLEAMSPDDRAKRINEAMRNGEMDTVGAALFFSDPGLFGLSPDRRELFRAAYRAQAYPELVARRATVETADQLLRRGLDAFVRDFNKRYDEKTLVKADMAATAAKRALGE